ncbi:hypothetical protein J8273_0605 [Carpediemonas membranifera]|uniref:Uncharacterized protein n=1 Tax=Carpediemonas membranifera TaxID=201153 RepID=A0A8J6B1V4_9EUKA|nr:hypothetical protein J8273_0605 [Carpediemonas membranifera]|eukprot:KAG9397475.1 hypothetical protein J8273_0605 [Carpediemonas membranifera]
MAEGHSIQQIRHEFLAVLREIALVCTSETPGDIPSLISRAISALDETNSQTSPATTNTFTPKPPFTIESLLSGLRLALSYTPPPPVQRPLSKARSILTDGPKLSMNSSLAEHEDLPERCYTLVQGTLWALLMDAGADPELGEGSDAYSNDSRLLWFICKKFFYVLCVSRRNGHLLHTPDDVHFASFCGHLYSRGRNAEYGTGVISSSLYVPTYQRVRVPRVFELNIEGESVLAITTRGMWAWGFSGEGQLGIEPRMDGISPPARVVFPDKGVQEYMDEISPWHRGEMIQKVYRTMRQTYVQTPCGILAAGYNKDNLLGVEANALHVVRFSLVRDSNECYIEGTDAEGRVVLRRRRLADYGRLLAELRERRG